LYDLIRKLSEIPTVLLSWIHQMKERVPYYPVKSEEERFVRENFIFCCVLLIVYPDNRYRMSHR